jgi:hypothetical protein
MFFKASRTLRAWLALAMVIVLVALPDLAR